MRDQKQCLGFPCDDLGKGAVDPIANLNNRHSLDRQVDKELLLLF